MSVESFEDVSMLGEPSTVGVEKKLRLKGGFSVGRAVNACIAFNYFLVLLTACVVAGTVGVLNDKVIELKILLSSV